MNLMDAEIGKTYTVLDIATDDAEMRSFLFTLGCFSGEPITVVARRRNNCTVSIKDGRYSFDKQLAGAVLV